MNTVLIKNIFYFFDKLTYEYGFNKPVVIDSENGCIIKYSSIDLIIKIEKYRNEIYLTLYNPEIEQTEINIFNLLEFLYLDDAPQSKYFENISDLDKRFKKQLEYISQLLFDNFKNINDFFNPSQYGSNIVELKEFMISRHPSLFR